MGARKKTVTGVRRLTACLLACLLLLSAMGTSALGAGVLKKTTTRAIAIVFDNSGSMYMEQNKAWCRATYAIEVFASMMNEGDTLQVYPMYDVTVNGITYTSQNPFAISGGSDTSVIQTMYTPYAGDTPIETIGDAYNGLKKLRADERWLIVLTDGAVFYEDGEPLKGDATKQRLEEVLPGYNRDVNVLYLGIDPVAVIPEVTGSGDYVYHSDKAMDSRDTLTKLTEMCNMIFGRDVLANAGNKMTFDVSMKRLFLFVQGSDISNVDLKDSSGKSVGQPSRAYSPRYGELGAGSVYKDGRALKFSVDKSLSGYIAVYDTELDAGTYTISYSGDVSSVSVYYEPDIDLAATLIDENGSVVTSDTVMYSGSYAIHYGLVDKDGEMTTSDLLGKTNYTVTYTVNGEEHVVRSDRSGRIDLELNEGDVLDGKFSVTYLSGYTINKNAVDFNWPSGGFKIEPRPSGLLELKVAGGQDTYKLSELENGSYAVQLIYEGTPLTAEQLAAAELSVSVEGGNVGYALEPTADGYTVNLKYTGPAAETVCGPYVLHLTANYTNEYGVLSESSAASIPFSVEDDGFGLQMDVEGETYFVISKLDESEPILVTLSADGAPLTDEQLANTTLVVDADGLTCETEPLFGQSAFAVRIVRDDKAESGHYKLRFAATAKDQVGRDITAEDDMKVTLRPYPRWLPLLIAILALLVIFALIWAYMSMKVLPKKIGVAAAQTTILVKGKQIPGAAVCSYSGGGKKKGSLKVAIPKLVGYPLVAGGFTLDLEAVSPRRVKSNRRRVKVTKISPSGASNLQNLTIGTHNLTKAGRGAVVNWMLDGNQIPTPSPTTKFELGGKPTCVITGVTTMKEKFIMTVQLQFK